MYASSRIRQIDGTAGLAIQPAKVLVNSASPGP